jgi:hypothetical protein
MPAERRIVRASSTFFDSLDEQLAAERGDQGQPSATDFLILDLPPVVERFATDFEALPEIVEGYSAGRMLIARGQLVRAFAVYGLLMDDDSIELIGVEIDLDR